ncbi:MAG: class I SAM-dependent methyltransferase [Bacteroidales bacterium]|jgi:ubiquinone/menaquinone biosynthesis C-methylase UbiE
METNNHICPVWVGYLMANPLRKLQQNPKKIFKNYIRPGMNILEIGPAMGFFSIPMAEMTGPDGKVYCVDIQKDMLKQLEKRALKKGVHNIIEPLLSNKDSLNIYALKGTVDFTLLANVVHEVPDRKKNFAEVGAAMKPNTKLLFIEPKMHVKEKDWHESLKIAGECGFEPVKSIAVSGSRAFELLKL